MGAVCAGITGLIIAITGVMLFNDEWVDDDQRWVALVLGLVFGLGTLANAVGWW